MRRILLVVLVPILVESAGRKAATRPSFLPTCYRNDPGLNRCLIDATEQMRPYLVKGVPQLQVPTFEPFRVPEIRLDRGTDALNINIVLKNVLVYGLAKYKFDRFEFDVPNYEAFARAHIPDGLALKGDHTINGRLLIVPIQGSGTFVIEIDSGEVYLHVKYQVTEWEDGKKHLVPILTNTSLSVERPRIQLEGLSLGNDELNAATNKVINDNVDILFEELKPGIERTISGVLENTLLGTFMTDIPWDELFPVNAAFPRNA